MSTGTCTVHSWNDGAEDDEGEPKMGRRVDQKLEENEFLYGDVSQSGRTRGGRLGPHVRSRGIGAAAADDDDNDEDGW